MTPAHRFNGKGEHPTILMVAPNGARRTKADHRAIPLEPAELAATAVTCVAAGAAAVHLHVRDAAGAHSLDPGRYRAALAAVRAEVGADPVLQITTEAAGRFDRLSQMAAVRDLVPEAVSLGLLELVPDDDVMAEAGRFFAWLDEREIAVQLILYAPREVARLVDLQARGILGRRPPSALFVLGRYSGPEDPVHPRDLVGFLSQWPADWPWMICAFGRMETAAAVAAAAMGGDVRIGFENSLEHADGRVARDNAERVRAVTAALDAIGRSLATPKEARARLGLTGSSR